MKNYAIGSIVRLEIQEGDAEVMIVGAVIGCKSVPPNRPDSGMHWYLSVRWDAPLGEEVGFREEPYSGKTTTIRYGLPCTIS